MYLVSFVIGLIIVISAILLIRSELNRAVRSQALLLQQSRVYKDADLFELLESLHTSVDEMNKAFYDIAGDLEGKFSIHDKEIQLLTEKAEMHLSKLANHEKKIIALEKSCSDQSLPVSTKTVKDSIEHMNTVSQKAIHKLDSEEQVEVNMTSVNQNQVSDQDSEVLAKIIELRSQGKSLPQIAKELEIGMGELQLLISLKK